MEDKVEHVLKMIQEDGDSFARRAEMYYKHRPELINFVEETVRAYRALAERYDKISTELQNANTTIASVFPDQVPYDMDYDDDFGSGPPKMPKNFVPPTSGGPNAPKVPKIPKVPNKDLKGLLTTASKKIQAKKAFTKPESHSHHHHAAPKSGLTKDEAVEEIDKLQKDILAMQTMKEFVKSSYESGLAKYWDIENKINEMQQKVCSLQDEFQVAKVIEDDDARTLMAEAALKSCQETLSKLEETQQKSSEDARSEHQRIEDAKQKIKNLKHKFLPDQEVKILEEKDAREKKSEISKQEDHQKELEAIRQSLEGLSKKPLTVSELAETIDRLVNKVISLESSVSSQTALIDRLRTETDELQIQIRNLEDDKAGLIEGTHTLGKKLHDMEEKLKGVEDLDQNVENQNNSLQTHFTEARVSIEHLSEKLQDVKPDEEEEVEVTHPKAEEPVEEKEIPLWLENSSSLKDELQRRCASLSNIQEEITMALREGMEEEEIKFSTHQAAKFQGEIVNMQQENTKVNEELQAGLDHVTALQLETEKTLGRLDEEFGLSDNPHHSTPRSPGRSGIPLRSFIFGVKQKKQKPSIFACIHHHRKFGASKGGLL